MDFSLTPILQDFLAATSLTAMAAVAAADIAAGTYEAIRNHTFKFTLFAGWLDTKVVKGMLPVVLMYATSLGVTGLPHDGLVAAARAGSLVFIAAQTASIYNHFQVKPPADTFPDEDPVPESASGL